MTEPSMQSQTEIIYCDSLPPHDQRAVIFHILYAVEIFEYEVSLPAIIDQFCRGFSCDILKDGPLYRQVQEVVYNRMKLDEEVRPLLHNWKFERISVAARLILRMSLWELQHTDLDAPVVMNEAVELAKSFAEEDAYKFINGLLDEWVRRNRSSNASLEHSPQ